MLSNLVHVLIYGFLESVFSTNVPAHMLYDWLDMIYKTHYFNKSF